MQWNTDSYLKYAAERTQPCIDLVHRILQISVSHAADLGCGPGNSTAILAERFPQAAITGVDTSAAMLEKARRDYPEYVFIENDIANWQPSQPCDLILANASLQWVPDHPTLIPRLVSCLRPGGVLAVQVPINLDAPNHTLMREVAARDPWADRMPGQPRYRVLDTDAYYDLLSPTCAPIEMWITEYLHVLDGPQDIVEWGRGTGLLPYLEPLSPAEQDEFLSRYLVEIRKVYSSRPDGKVLFPFRRLFFIAVRGK